MFSTDDIRQAARELFVQGEKPTVRNVREALGGGSQGRISAVIKELRLPKPEPEDTAIPPYLLNALHKFMLENKSAASSDSQKTIEDLRSRIAYLEAQVEALSDTLSRGKTIQRDSSSIALKVMRECAELPGILIDGETITQIREKSNELRTSTQKEVLKLCNKHIHRKPVNSTPLKGRITNIFIDGLKGSQILKSHVNELTEDQLQWKRKYENDKRRYQIVKNK